MGPPTARRQPPFKHVSLQADSHQMWESCILPAGEEITDGHRVESCLNPEMKELQGELDGADLTQSTS